MHSGALECLLAMLERLVADVPLLHLFALVAELVKPVAFVEHSLEIVGLVLLAPDFLPVPEDFLVEN